MAEIKSQTAFGPKVYKLPGVKECLYHPRLPTFRRMDMDTAAHKLPDEHCRTTTPLTRGNFKKATVTFFKPAEPQGSAFNGTEKLSLGYMKGYITQFHPPMHKDFYHENRFPTQVTALTITGWKDGEDREETENTKNRNSRFQNYTYLSQLPFAVKYSTPATLGSWKFTLRQEPFIDHIGQRPNPATIFSRYRSTSNIYGMATRHWLKMVDLPRIIPDRGYFSNDHAIDDHTKGSGPGDV